MVDTDLNLAKADSVKRHLNRVFEKRNTDIGTFLKNIDIQESVLLKSLKKNIRRFHCRAGR